MALTTIWKGQLKISLVSFPVRLYAAVGSTNKLALNQLHKQCQRRIQLDTFCPKHGQLAKSEITKGYEYERYCQMLWMGFFLAQQRKRFAGHFDLFISPTSKARFSKALTMVLAQHLASAGR